MEVVLLPHYNNDLGDFMRTYSNMNEDWQFRKSVEHPAERINLPHTWNYEDGQDGGNDYYRGIGIYEKNIECEELALGERVFLEFEGVNLIATVRVQEEVAGIHEGGYSTFRVELTKWLLEYQGKVNIQVEVDNRPNRTVYPQKADFTFYGGIYRRVRLIRVPAAHFSLTDYGSQGIYITPKVEAEDAVICVRSLVEDEFDLVRYKIMDGLNCVCEWETKELESEVRITKVRKWNGIHDPHLYELQAEIIVKDKVQDQVSISFGCRTYEFDAEKGFLLNHQVYPLRGVSRHQDRKGVGNALTTDMHKEDLDLIREIGANSIRLAHYQHDPYFYDLCDRFGIVVWAEIPYISEHMPEANDNTRLQLTELICQNYHRPSVAVWGLSNEITVTNLTEDLVCNHEALKELAHQLDPTRKTTIAHVFMLPMDDEFVHIADVMAYNLYYGWYLGELDENDRFFDTFREKHPEAVIGLSEYGADCNIQFQNEEPYRGDYSEQYQCIYHEHMLKMIEKRPYLWCTYLWNMFDFGADGRDEAEDFGVNHKGLVTFDRKVKKDAFYAYKAYWSKEAFVHLCGKRYQQRCHSITKVKVYSNLDEVQLYVDGELFREVQGKAVFDFEVPITTRHKILVKGYTKDKVLLQDRMEIEYVTEKNPEYTLQCAAIHNWFEDSDLTRIDGFYSIQDTIGELRENEETAVLVEDMMQHALKARGDVAQNLQHNEAIEQMIRQSTVIDFVKLAGGSITQEMVMKLNRQLSKIKKLTFS